ncbi:MAG: branched-chain amino acid transaminase [Candidatus Latescibacteria bacterium]|jgi:branched-chain amino acid aminotransferase|nr:branched-chain amino acid transaminase [Candidatus Latescibacterota bacterium]MDP7235516.1 branched-chain amino acid transaminase [Candidatus Latescibacterota bacterium]
MAKSKSFWGEHPEHIWLDGEIVPWDQATMHITQGHIFAHSIFEGIRAYWNQDQEKLYVFQLDAHLERLYRSIKLMRMETDFTLEDLRTSSIELCLKNEYREDIYVFPSVYFQSNVYLNKMVGPTHTYIQTFPHASELDRTEGATCGISSWTRITDNMLPARIKCWANYRNSAIAWTQETLSGFDEAIMMNTHGKICEAPGACLGMVQDGVLLTPSVTSDILVSVTRNTILQIASELLGVPVVEREIDRTEIYTTDEIFLCGTGAEITPVTSIDHYTIGDGGIGPVTQQLRQTYNDLIRGIDTRHPEWRTEVI